MSFQLKALRGHKDVVNCLCSLDEVLYSGSDDGTVRIWDMRTERTVKVLGHAKKGSSCFVQAVDSICTSDNRLVYAACGNEVLAFDMRSHPQSSIMINEVTQRLLGKRSCEASRDDHAAAAAAPGEVEVEEDECVSTIAQSGCGSWLAAADDAGAVYLTQRGGDTEGGWEGVTTGSGVHNGLVNSLLLDGQVQGQVQGIFSAGFDSVLCYWDAVTKGCERALQPAHTLSISSGVATYYTYPPGASASTGAAAASKRTVQRIPVPPPAVQLKQAVNPPFIHQVTRVLNSEEAGGMGGTVLACGVGDGSLRFYTHSRHRGDGEGAVEGFNSAGLVEDAHGGMLTTMAALSPTTLATAGIDGLIKVWVLAPSGDAPVNPTAEEAEEAEGAAGAANSVSNRNKNRRNRQKRMKQKQREQQQQQQGEENNDIEGDVEGVHATSGAAAADEDFVLRSVFASNLVTLQHGRKVNMLVGRRLSSGAHDASLFYVADTSADISIYSSRA